MSCLLGFHNEEDSVVSGLGNKVFSKAFISTVQRQGEGRKETMSAIHEGHGQLCSFLVIV